ncbi:hypothetical protein [Sulfuricella sp. T08]|uniref:hypothetical protein n=1 Tax=Sulfuricella sp. T08 TaxID=1632857 RepID=UPI0007515DEA|nr:hypothetical protein [Sulfuricella sp. T08]
MFASANGSKGSIVLKNYFFDGARKIIASSGAPVSRGCGGLRKLFTSLTKGTQTDPLTLIEWDSQSDWFSAEIWGIWNFEFFNTIGREAIFPFPNTKRSP